LKNIKLVKYTTGKDLKVLPFNREFHVRKVLQESMHKYGFIHPILVIQTDIITGEKESYVVDGQHRMATALSMDIPFYANVLDLKFKSVPKLVNFVSTLNSTQKRWATMDYVKAYAMLGYADYVQAVSVKSRTRYTIDTICRLLHSRSSNKNTLYIVKDGNFRINLLEETKETLKLASKLDKYEIVTSRILEALHNVMAYKEFNEAAFIEKYKCRAKIIKDLKLDTYLPTFISWIKE